MRHSHKVTQHLYQKREGLGFLSLASMTQPPENTGTTLAGGLRI